MTSNSELQFQSSIPAQAGRPVPSYDYRTILGVNFFTGSAQESVDLMLSKGGLLVVPAAPALKDLPNQPEYREALLGADLAIMDSALMVMVWNRIAKERLQRLSGLEYLVLLLEQPQVRVPGKTMWIMASPSSAKLNLEWFSEKGIDVPEDCVYLAPVYGSVMSDPVLLDKIAKVRPDNIIVTVGGGTQERLGLYIRRNLNYVPGIHCIGAAIAFLSGDQVKIPLWADRFALGWFFRCVSEPKRYFPRYWAARKLVSLMVRYRSQAPA
jgi:UDP-N-acetyl-D-mannosaminuronic acid transferase (WecB/TagA/CpsF family)